MAVRRAMPILTVTEDRARTALYADLLGLDVVMDHGWIATLADPGRNAVQLSLMTQDETAPTNPAVSIEVDDVDAAHAAAVAAGLEIVHPLSDEAWGVRRFFFRDPDGNVVNVLAHAGATGREADAGAGTVGDPTVDGTAPEVAAFVGPLALARDGIRLVPLRDEHAAGLAEAAADGELWRLAVTSVPAPGTEQAYVAMARATPDRVPFAVLDADGTVIGTTSYHDVLPGPRRLSIGFTWYAARHQRTAVNTTCKLLLLDHAFQTAGARTVGWVTDGENHASQRAIERLGARKDGTLRGHALRRDGSLRDTVAYSLTAAEWPGVRERLEHRLARGGDPDAAENPRA